MLLLWLLLASPLVVTGEAECSEQHFCSCPPFLRGPGTGGRQLHFTKHNYDDQFAIVGKSKELHCCLGPEWDSILWSKDGAGFPWGGDRSSILYSNNQSLIMMEVGESYSGTYTCEARRGGEVLRHSTTLQSFPAPVFSHPPIWNSPPTNVTVTLGRPAVLSCSATVGQQYNSVSMEPVHAAWIRYGREVQAEEGRVQVEQRWTDDDIVTHLRLEVEAATQEDAGEYRCRVQTEYGTLEATATLQVTVPEAEQIAGEEEVQKLLKQQLEIYQTMARIIQTNPSSFQDMLKEAGAKLS